MVPVVLVMLLASMALAACGAGDDTEPTTRPTAAESGGATREAADEATREPSDEATREPGTTASQDEADEGGEEADESGDEPEPTRRGVLGRTGSGATSEPEATGQPRGITPRSRSSEGGDAREERDFIFVSAGVSHTCAITGDGSVVCWGESYSGSKAASPVEGRFISISASHGYTCGLMADSSIACWGSNICGVSIPPSGEFVSVSTGGSHNCGVRKDGHVVCWVTDIPAVTSQPVRCQPKAASLPSAPKMETVPSRPTAPRYAGVFQRENTFQ